jgi:amino acid transporter
MRQVFSHATTARLERPQANMEPAHMAEELQDASYKLPRVMLWATIINGGMMFVMAVTVTYCIGDLESGKNKVIQEAVLSTGNSWHLISMRPDVV